MKFLNLILSELIRLKRPLFFGIAVVSVAVSAMFAAISQEGASGVIKSAHWSVAHQQKEAGNHATCKHYDLSPGAECDRAVAEDLQQAQGHLRRVLVDYKLVGSSQSPVGAIGFAVGVMCSLPGAFIVLLLAGIVVGSEFGGRTISTVLLQDGRRWRVLAAKTLAIWATAIVLTIFASLGLILFGLLSQFLWPIETHATSGAVATWTFQRVAAAPLVLLVFAVIGVTAGVFTRHPVASVLAGGGFLAISNLLVHSGVIPAVTPVSWIGDLMGFNREIDMLIDHFWADVTASQLSPVLATMALIGLIIALFTVSVTAFKRRDILN